MRTFYKILLIIIAIAYLISPIDLIPDFLVPYIGWLDDAVVLWLIFYYLKFNRLPSFFYRQKKTDQNGQAEFNNYNNDSSSNKDHNREQNQKGEYEKARNNNRNHQDHDRNHNYDQNQNHNETEYHGQNLNKNPYDILGVDKNATKQEIHAAYRRLVKQYHPDRFAHLGKEFQELASKKFIEIKDAYNHLL